MQQHNKFYSLLLLFAGVLTAGSCHADAQDTVEPKSAPASAETGENESQDVLVLVGLVQDELELIRFEMGKPENKQPEIRVTNAAPREVFFQALTLFRKADRLCFEQTRERAKQPETPEMEISPAHVREVVDAALSRIRRVKEKLNITAGCVERPRDESKMPSDVFRAIVEANRQLNLLLDRQFSPSDVFQQVTLAVSYSASLLARFPGTTRIPETPPLEHGKLPADVYRRLLSCFSRLREITQRSGLKMLDLESTPPERNSPENVTPSDVYDIASLLISELAHLHAQLKDAEPPNKVYYSGRKFPAHVYQRAGILQAQLIELQKLIDKAANWLH